MVALLADEFLLLLTVWTATLVTACGQSARTAHAARIATDE